MSVSDIELVPPLFNRWSWLGILTGAVIDAILWKYL